MSNFCIVNEDNQTMLFHRGKLIYKKWHLLNRSKVFQKSSGERLALQKIAKRDKK